MAALETQLLMAMLGGTKPSVLMTDGYKFSMAQAGAPLRTETFYLSFRRKGWYYVPFDLECVVAGLSPAKAGADELGYLADHGYGLTSDMSAALDAIASVWSAPKGSWVREGEPILTVTAPSFLASWLEPLLIWLHLPIQIATAALEGEREFIFSCESEARIAAIALRAVGLEGEANISWDERGYEDEVKNRSESLLRVVNGESDRLLEVGMRGAGCIARHRCLLREAASKGIRQTSNVFLARELGLVPIGTTGHEHQQRWGRDLDGFRAIRDLRSGTPSYLFDTYDALALGIPAAIEALREAPDRNASVRFDSGEHELQLRTLAAAGVEPTYVFMDSMNPKRIADIEAVAAQLQVPSRKRLYGVGGFLAASGMQRFTRDRVAAVYKLSESGEQPVMKFSVPGKISCPGKPRIFRRRTGKGPIGLVGQQGEAPPQGYTLLATGSLQVPTDHEPVRWSAQTERLAQVLRDKYLSVAH